MEHEAGVYGDIPKVPPEAAGRPHPFVASPKGSGPFTSKPELSGGSNVAGEIARIVSHT